MFTGGSASRIRLTQGEVKITETLTIDASGVTGIVISGDAVGDDSLVAGTLITDVTASLATDVLDDNTRVFNFSSPTGDLTLENLTITGGRTTDFSEDGGGIRFGSNDALTVTNSLISGNSTIDYLDYGYQAYGGGIATDSGTVTLIGSTVSDNRTTGFGAHGGGIYNDSGVVTLIDSTVSDNSTAGEDAYGGGLYTYSGTIVVTGSTISGNSTSGSSEADGGGIFNDSGVIRLTSSTISDNYSSGDGGGIGTRYGSVTLTGSTVSGNSTTGAGHGGGIYTATGHESYSTSGRVSLTNSTVSGNRSGGHGGGIASGGDPTWQESIYNSHALKLTNSTISDNEAAGEGGGVYVFNHSKNSRLTLENSIIAGNLEDKSPDNSGTPSDLLPDPDSTLTSNYSLIGVANGLTLTGTGNLTGTAAAPQDAGLTPLGEHGGPTRTHALLPGSPAIDTGNPSILFHPSNFDQRGNGYYRIVGDRMDIGAVEATPPVISAPSDVETLEDIPLTLSAANGNALSFTATDAGMAAVEFTLWASDRFSDITFADTTGVTVIQDGGSTPKYRLQGTVSAINTVLSAGVTFLPVAHAYGATALSLTANDGIASTTFQLPITINAVNDPPAIDPLGSLQVAGLTNTASGYTVAALTATDPDGPQPATFSIIGGADAALFSLGGADNNELILEDSILDFDRQQSYVVEVRANDSVDDSLTLTVQVDVTELPEFGGDFSGDQRNDRAFFKSSTNELMVWLDLGDRKELSIWGILDSSANWSEFHVGDFNGDGRDDIIALDAATNEWTVALSDSNRFSMVPTGLTTPNWNFAEVYVGDFNGDGSQELLGWNGIHWEVADYDERFGTSVADWDSAIHDIPGISSIQIADANRDGRDDLIASDGVDWYVGLSQNNNQFASQNWNAWFDSYTNPDGTVRADEPIQQIIDRFEDVYNNVELELYRGFLKGIEATEQTNAGNPFDQAALLVDRLDADGFDANIAIGTIEAPLEIVRDWIGAPPGLLDDPFDVSDGPSVGIEKILHEAFDPNAQYVSAIDAFQFEHAWVEVIVPTAAGLDTVYLDPSWKFKDHQSGVYARRGEFTGSLDATIFPGDSLGLLEFTAVTTNPFVTKYSAFLNDYVANSSLRESPQEKLESDIELLLPAHTSLFESSVMASLSDVPYDGPIINRKFTQIPTGLGESVAHLNVTTYSDLDDLIGDSVAKNIWTHRVEIEVSGSTSTPALIDHEIVVASSSLRHTTITYSGSRPDLNLFYLQDESGSNIVQGSGNLLADEELKLTIKTFRPGQAAGTDPGQAAIEERYYGQDSVIAIGI